MDLSKIEFENWMSGDFWEHAVVKGMHGPLHVFRAKREVERMEFGAGLAAVSGNYMLVFRMGAGSKFQKEFYNLEPLVAQCFVYAAVNGDEPFR